MESRTRRTLSGIAITCAAAAALCASAIVASASAGKATQPGVFALLGGTQDAVAEFWAVHGAGLTATLKVKQFKKDGTTPIVKYDIDMQKYMHMVVIRDDFATFNHLHPDFDVETGTFSAPFTKEAGHKYYLYADSRPQGRSQQVFRFTMESDGALAGTQPSLTASSPASAAGPYVITMAKTTVAANTPYMMYYTVTVDGKPAQDLTPYLGAAAHCVLIDTSTLQYVHVHPMLHGQKMNDQQTMTAEQEVEQAESNSQVGPNQQVQLPALPAGTYKMWIQIKGGGAQHTYTAPFTLVAQ